MMINGSLRQISFSVQTDLEELEYHDLLSNSKKTMFTQSFRYIKWIINQLDNAQLFFIIARRKQNIIGLIPVVLSKNMGTNIVNSLPFFGSHGGVIIRNQVPSIVADELLNHFNDFCRQNFVLSATIVEGLEGGKDTIYQNFVADFLQVRVTQISRLPIGNERNVLEEDIMKMCTSKTRNAIRKINKFNFKISHSDQAFVTNCLYTQHKEGIDQLGGLVKPKNLFSSLDQFFEYGSDYRVYFAEYDGQIISCLLVFYYNSWVEYFTPTILSSHRSLQPLSSIIFRAMSDSVLENDSIFWNWGGTWPSQSSLYKFKNSWGAKDFPYTVRTKITYEDKDFEKMIPELRSSHPYFYIYPY